MKNWFFLVCFLLANLAIAGSFEVTSPTTAALDGISMTRIGSGIRQKTVLLFVTVDVYRASLFASDPSHFVRNIDYIYALNSMQNMDARAIELHMLRDLSAQDVSSGFNEALKANGVRSSKPLTEFLQAVSNSGDVKNGETIVIGVDNKKGVLILEQGEKHIEIKGNPDFFRQIFAIWLGKPADPGLSNLKNALILGKD